jgi:hypothetical protein
LIGLYKDIEYMVAGFIYHKMSFPIKPSVREVLKKWSLLFLPHFRGGALAMPGHICGFHIWRDVDAVKHPRLP